MKLVGVLNITDDSFSDGGQFLDSVVAIKHARQMVADGASIIDIGAESSGPTSSAVDPQVEIDRLVPVVEQLAADGITVSIDTTKSIVARAGIVAGAQIINDIGAFRFDPDMAEVLADSNCQIIMMYGKDDSARTTVSATDYDDVIDHISNFFTERLDHFASHGGDVSRVILDPGMGHFVSSNPKYSFEIINRLPEFKQRFPDNELLLGISRKSCIGGKLADRDLMGLPLSALAVLNGADYLRVHNVAIHQQYFADFNQKLGV